MFSASTHDMAPLFGMNRGQLTKEPRRTSGCRVAIVQYPEMNGQSVSTNIRGCLAVFSYYAGFLIYNILRGFAAYGYVYNFLPANLT